MSQEPFDPFRYNADTVPPLVRQGLARIAVPELSPSELEPPPGLKRRLASLASRASAPVALAAPERRNQRHSRSRWVVTASILFVVVPAIFAVVLVLLRP